MDSFYTGLVKICYLRIALIAKLQIALIPLLT